MSYIGFDIGTGNLVCSKYLNEKKSITQSMRNMFLPVSPDTWSTSEISNTNLDYVELYENDGSLQCIAIIGEDAFRFANIFGQEVKRSMKSGLISSKEIDSVDIIGHMIKHLCGELDKDQNYCVFSIPAQPIDLKNIPNVTYHEKVFTKVFESLGFKVHTLNEGMAVVYSNCKDEDYSGIGISFGAGLTNIACSYKGIPALTFSVGVGGDWIDKNVAESTGKLETRVIAIKEKKLNLSDETLINEGKKEEVRIKQGLLTFYEELIDYVLKTISKEFQAKSDNLEIDEKIPIILSGGTSMVPGFLDLFTRVFNEKYRSNFPYDIKEIKMAKEPLYSVAIGCLEYCLLLFKEQQKKGE